MQQPSVPVPPPPYPQPPPPPAEEINEVAIEVEQEEGEDGTVEETFTDYRPPKLPIGPCHPDPVVETSSLSAVHPPEPTYDLKIKDELESSGPLSCLQIETLVYACQRHLQHLPDGARAGFFIGDGAGVGKGRTIAGLILENWRHGRRKALWISVGSDLKFDARRDLDDVGATNIEVHALNKLSYSKLDSKSVGVREGVIFLTYSCLIASTDRGRSRLQQLVQWCGSKYEGLVIFDECHKAKNLIPEPKGHPTQTGQAVLELQARLPEARIIYCSATGASEPRNMGYMVRLGLWGAGTCFVDFHDFLGTIQKRGVGALELVAMDMKARGMYVCRTLSYKGAEFEVVEIPLEARVMDMYNRASEFWAELRLDLLSASEFLTDKKSKSLLWRLYWANHQRFFSHMCMSAKVSAVVRLAKQALIENKCVVIGIQSTGEARTEEAVEKYGLELDGFISGPRELLLTFVEGYYPLPPKPEILPEVRGKNLPRKRHFAAPGVADGGRVRKVAKCEAGSDDESDEESEVDSEHESTEWEVESDADSDEEFESDFEPESSDEFQICETYDQEEPVHPKCLVPPVIDAVSSDFPCQSGHGKQDEYLQGRNAPFSELLKRYEGALERRSNILDVIRSLELPDNPLDNIIDQLGGPCNVAEITGRRGRLVRNSDGKGVTYQARNTKGVPVDMVNMHEKQLFMDGKKLVAIISEAGSAGVSLQADRRAINQKRRVHLTLELPWSADRAIQQFGRTHRSNQTSAPEYRLLFTNLGGERRFASIVAKRLESLGALTQGDRRAGPSLSAYNYDSAYGKKALMLMYKGIMEQDSLPVVPPGCKPENPGAIQDFTAKAKAALASVAIVKGTFSGHISDWLMHDVARFLNRILGLPPDMQNRLFELFVSIFDLVIRKARLEGHFDSGIVKMRANTIELRGTPKVVHHDPMSRASTVLFTFTLDRGTTWKSASALLDEKQKDGSDLTNIGFYESRKDWKGTRHFVLAIKGSASGLYKIFRPATGEAREMHITELKGKYRKVSRLEKACSGWEAAYEVSSKQCMHGPNCKHGNFCTVGRRLLEVNVLGGLILPIWGSIEKALSKQALESHKRLRVVRIETTKEKQQFVGLLIPNAAVASVLQGVQDVGD